MRIDIEAATKVIGGVRVLDDVSATFQGGRIYGLRGRNGSGKTMLLRALCGLIVLTEGSVSIDGETLGRDRSFPKSVGALIESPGFVGGYTGMRNLREIASIKGVASDERIANTMCLMGLDPAERKKVRAYSLGMRQKLGLACALMEDPELILLDEPLNALDEQACGRVLSILRELRDKGALIVVAAHDREELDFLSDEIIEMKEGRIVARHGRDEGNVAAMG